MQIAPPPSAVLCTVLVLVGVNRLAGFRHYPHRRRSLSGDSTYVITDSMVITLAANHSPHTPCDVANWLEQRARAYVCALTDQFKLGTIDAEGGF